MSWIGQPVHGPVTALACCFDSLILAGIGPHLHIYSVTASSPTLTKLSPLKVLQYERIHFIRELDVSQECQVFACIGVKSFATVEISGEKVKVSKPWKFADRIMDIRYLNHEEVAILFGFNNVVRFDVLDGEVKERVQCEDCSILYSGKILGQKWDDLVVLAGSVFNQVLIWTIIDRIVKHETPQDVNPSPDTKRGSCIEPANSRIIHRLKGHDGVIFSLDFDERKNLICSASDDRSIRLWRIIPDQKDGEDKIFDPEPDQIRKNADAEQSTVASDHSSYVQLDANIAAPLPSAITPSSRTSILRSRFLKARIHPEVIMYGHTARIWSARLLEDSVVSLGEDGSLCEWNYQGSLVHKVSFHNIKSLRALAVDQGERMLVTAGEDGGIQVHERAASHDQNDARVVNLPDNAINASESERTSSQTSSTKENSSEKKSKDFPRDMKILNGDEILVFTDAGKLFSFEPSTESWALVIEDTAFKGYCCLAVDRQTELAAVGNINGTVKLCDLAEFREMDTKIHEQKVTPLLFIRILEELHLLTTVRGECGQFNMLLYTVDFKSLKLLKARTFPIPSAKNSFINAVHFEATSNWLVCGDKEGFIICYDIESESKVSMFKGHGKGGVSCFRKQDELLQTTGRDGLLNTYSFSENDFKLVSSNKLIKGLDWIQSICENDGGTMFVSGFHSTKFQIFRPDLKQKLCEIDCGGGHRLNDLFVSDADAIFVYNRDVSLVVNKLNLRTNQTIIRMSLHGKEITSLAHLFSQSQQTHYFASASEDTTCKIISINSENQIRVLETLTTHISAVKCIHSVRMKTSADENDFLLFSCGGRGQLNVAKISINESGCTSRHLASHTADDGSGIRYTAVTTMVATDSKVAKCDTEIVGFYHVFLTGSDGCVRILTLNESGRLTMRGKSTEQVGCLMDICAIHNSDYRILITCSSSGYITLFEIRAFLESIESPAQKTNGGAKSHKNESQNIPVFEPISSHQIHRSGVSAIALQPNSDSNAMILASVGDDNILKISRIHLEENRKFDIEILHERPHNHASNITQVNFLNAYEVVTVGSDQRAIFWKMLGEDYDVEAVQVVYGNVPDMLSLCTWEHESRKHALVGGVGVQILSYELDR